jgi:hypothetical protein
VVATDKRSERVRCVGCGGPGSEGTVSGQAVDVKTAIALGWRKKRDGWWCDACLEWERRTAR